LSLATLEVADGIATITLRRPEARNALSLELLGALHDRCDELASRSDAHVALLRGEGKAFCAGMDLKAVLHDPAAPRRLLRSIAELTLKVRALPMVTVAMAHGAAIGGGCGLACVCDVVLTHAESKMGYPEVDLGVCPAVVAPWLVRKIGAGRARRVLLMGGVMSGGEAFALGMADLLARDEAELASMTSATVSRLARGGPEALRTTKALLNRLDGSELAGHVRQGAELSADVIAAPQTQQRLREKLGPGR
jgi:isohexenylglutaconyl-CoA hydratase